MAKTTFVFSSESAKMARALDNLAVADRDFVSETISFLGAKNVDAEEVSVSTEAGLLAMRIEKMSPEDRNVLKGLVSRIMTRAKDRKGR